MFQQYIHYTFTDSYVNISIKYFVYRIGYLMHFICIKNYCNIYRKCSLIIFTHFSKLFIILHKASELFLYFVTYKVYTTYFSKFQILFIVLLLRHLFLTNCYQLLTVFPIENCHHLLTDLPCDSGSTVNSLCIITFWQYHSYVACGIFVIYNWQFIHEYCLHVQENLQECCVLH